MNIYLDQKWNRIGISLSGGADSALLAYLICKNVSTTTDIHITNQHLTVTTSVIHMLLYSA